MPKADRDRIDRSYLPPHAGTPAVDVEVVRDADRRRGPPGTWQEGPGSGRPGSNNLLAFLNEAAKRTKHVLLGTATPIQTDIADLWDLMKVLGKGASHVMGDGWSLWNDHAKAIPVITISACQLTISFGATSSGCKVETFSSTPVATTDTRIAPSRLSSKAAPT